MNGFHFAPIPTRRARLRRTARSIGLAALGLVVIGLGWRISPWRSGPDRQLRALPATLADAPSWDRVRPAWPKYLPEVPPASQVAACESPAADHDHDHGYMVPDTAPAITPAVIRGPVETPPPPPSILAGPELFGPTIQPVVVAPTQPQPSLPNMPPQVLGAGSAQPVPVPPAVLPPPAEPARDIVPPLPTEPATAVTPPPARLPVVQPIRSEAMEKIAVQSDQQIRHGFELANRGAYFAARAEFVAALRLIAQGLDNQGNTTLHSQALGAALTAMKEAQDFIPASGKLEADLDLPPIVAGHRTPVLKHVPPEQLQAMRALKQYFTFAQEQFALAAGQEVSGSMALAALGKMHAALAGKPVPEIVAAEAKAIVFFQAAILACPRNYMAANDLGVVLAHSGDAAGARRALEHSVLICRCAENLSNLSVVYRQMGQPHLADLAAEKSRLAKAEESARQKRASLSAGGSVEWVDPDTLAQSAGQWADPAAKPATAGGQQGPSVTR
jgi:hypothetical protein